MKTLTLTLAVGAMLLSTGCSDIVSLDSFADDDHAVQDPGLVGVWSEGEGEPLFIVKADGRGYAIAYVESEGAPIRLKAMLFQSGDARILDVEPAAQDNPFQLPVHTPVRIWTGGGTLKFAFLDPAGLRQLAHQMVGKRFLLTARGPAVMGFLTAARYDTPAVLYRQ